MTKHLSKDEIRQIMDGLMHQHSEGLNADAPELSLVGDTWHDNWVQTFLVAEWYENGHAEQLMMSKSLQNEEDMTDERMGTCEMGTEVGAKQRQWSSDDICGNYDSAEISAP